MSSKLSHEYGSIKSVFVYSRIRKGKNITLSFHVLPRETSECSTSFMWLDIVLSKCSIMLAQIQKYSSNSLRDQFESWVRMRKNHGVPFENVVVKNLQILATAS